MFQIWSESDKNCGQDRLQTKKLEEERKKEEEEEEEEVHKSGSQY